MESFIQTFKYLRDVNNDHKIHETLRKLVTDNLLKLSQEENQQCSKECYETCKSPGYINKRHKSESKSVIHIVKGS